MKENIRIKYLDKARGSYHSDVCEIDDNAEVSISEQDGRIIGVWVEAWVWVSTEK